MNIPFDSYVVSLYDGTVSRIHKKNIDSTKKDWEYHKFKKMVVNPEIGGELYIVKKFNNNNYTNFEHE